jgi:putative phosphoserine phosphatase/1-acylglycerol-3-phosphate O-acyltransferase
MSDPEIVREQPQIGAFFDMDKTILSQNSATLFMRYRYQRGDLGNVDLLKGLGAYLQYKFGILDLRRWTLGMLVQFRGQSERQLEEEAIAWVEDMVVATIYPEARRLVREHADAGHVVAIVSGATRFVVRPIAAHVGVEHILYTRLEVDDGLFTGRVIEPICFEEGKIYWLQQFIEEQRIDLAKSHFYTDSITDLPLLEIVGHPVATNPDPLLYRTAVKRRWPIRFFDPPSATAAS